MISHVKVSNLLKIKTYSKSDVDKLCENLNINFQRKTRVTLLRLGIILDTEAVVQRCSVKKVFLETSQNPQEKTCVRVSFLIKLQLY